ncbi:MAG: diguanylate cyclase, partial [Leptospiraceae bacterium]|nr:diguanylate cyclase [Leptospiraceae bacterium]
MSGYLIFIEGLSFFMLGAILWSRLRTLAGINAVHPFRWLAGATLLYGVSYWLYLAHSSHPAIFIILIQIVSIGAYAGLLLFAFSLYRSEKKPARLDYVGVAGLICTWLLVITTVDGDSHSTEFWTLIILALPGHALTAIGLIDNKRCLDLKRHSYSLVGAGVGFALHALFTLSESDRLLKLLPFLNSSANDFLQGEPGQALHAICAIGILVCVLNALIIFDSIEKIRLQSYLQNARKLLSESEEKYQAIVEQALVGLFFLSENRLLFVNPRFAEIFGYTAEELLSIPMEDIVHPDDRALFRKQNDPQQEARTVRYTLRGKHKDDRTIYLEVHAIHTRLGKSRAVLGVLLDVTEQKSNQDRMHQLAYYDYLTGLPGRRFFLDRLRNTATPFDMNTDVRHLVAVLIVDIDRFRLINESLGHRAGDELLIAVAERLNKEAGGNLLLARLGGDEFGILMENMEGAHASVIMAGNLLELMSEPMEIEGHEISISASIGIAISSHYYDNPEYYLRDAESALHTAKKRGRNCFQIFNASMHAEALHHLELEADLRLAIQEREITVHFQPILSAQSGRIIGAEALARWEHFTMGSVSPQVFVRLAEETGLISKLGELVLEESCRHLVRWRRLPDCQKFKISVNLSPGQLRQRDFPETLQRVLSRHNLPADALILEITENIALEDRPVEDSPLS